MMESKKKKINKLAGYRTMLGMNQTEMGTILGISKQAYSRKETGKISFKDSEKILIKELLLLYFPEVTMEDLFF